MDSDKSSSDSKSTGIRPAVAIFCRSVLTEIFGYLPVETVFSEKREMITNFKYYSP